MNPIINAISSRSSYSKLGLPAPSTALVSKLIENSLRVPDHALLRPWRFLIIEKDGLTNLGKVFADVHQLKNPDANKETLEKIASKAQRAPMIVIGICQYKAHDKVPEIEQQLSTGCVLHNLGLSLTSLGYASVWRTGSFANDPTIHTKLGLTKTESLIGYLYIGTAEGKEKTRKALEIDQHIQIWSGL